MGGGIAGVAQLTRKIKRRTERCFITRHYSRMGGEGKGGADCLPERVIDILSHSVIIRLEYIAIQ